LPVRLDKKSVHDIPVARLASERKALLASMGKMPSKDFVCRHAALVDAYFMESFTQSRSGTALNFAKNPFAVVALGGYGRCEQCVHSDVDVMILFKNRVPRDADELVRDLVYPLWDIGIEVGYSTRSVGECMSIAKDDINVLISFLDARFVCGMSSLYDAFIQRLDSRIAPGRRAALLIRDLADLNSKRHKEYGDSTFLLEPNLKEGKGGLRDYHMLFWISKIQFGIHSLKDLIPMGVLAEHDYAAINDALLFVWDVRNRLHRLAGRRCDRLYFDYQRRLALEMDYAAKNGQQPVERFMGMLHLRMEIIKEQLLLFLYELGIVKPSRRSRRSGKTAPDGIVITNKGLAFDLNAKISGSPGLLMRIFEASAHLRLPLTREALTQVRRFSRLVGESYWKLPGIKDGFEKILMAPAKTAFVIEQMLSSGFLGRLIPEFEAVADRIQFDSYHIYPVDRHLLRTVQIMKSLGEEEPSNAGSRLAGRLYAGLKKKRLLLIAALLHDIGKGSGRGNHSGAGAAMIPAILSRMGYDEKETDTVRFLVAHHLLLMKTAMRRDISDEETVLFVARRVESATRLKMLYLLSVADAMATGPKAWNDWTAELLKSLFLKTVHAIENKGIASGSAGRRMEMKRDAVCKRCAEISGLNKDHIRDILTPRYILAMSVDEILYHLRIYSRFKGRGFVFDVSGKPGLETRDIVICAGDRPGLFSFIAGAFALNGMEILNARIYTWKNNIALDLFTVSAPPDPVFEDQCWKKFEQDLGRMMENPAGVSMKFFPQKKVVLDKRPPRVVVDNQSSGFFTIIEVFSHDSPGLLYRITDVLSRAGLDIWVSKISTKVDQVVDVFYVRDTGGEKLESQCAISNLKKELLAALEKTDG